MKEDSRREKRNRILEEAGKLFVRDGIDATKIIDIARASGVAKGTVYEYFDSKDDIVIAWIRSTVQDSQAQLQKLLAEELTTKQRLEGFVEHMLEQSSKIRVTAKILMDARFTEKIRRIHITSGEACLNDLAEDRLLSFIFENVHYEVDFIKAILKKGMEQKELRPGLNVNFVSYIILSTIPFLSMGKKSLVPEDVRCLLAEKMGFELFDWEGEDLCRLILEGISA